MFNSTTYIDRRTALAKRISKGILLFLGNGESPINYLDNAYAFRQDSTFLYYFGISLPGLAAIVDLDENKTIVFGDEMSIDDIVWMGKQTTLKDYALSAGVLDVLPSSRLKDYLEVAGAKKRPVHFLPPYRGENKIRLSSLLGLSVHAIANSVSIEFIKAVVGQRSIKSSEEINEIQKAVNHSGIMHRLAMSVARPGMTEQELMSLVHGEALNTGGNLAYPIIMTVRGEVLHNHSYNNTLKDGQLVLNDSGMETAMGYCGDLTRTFPVGKQFDPRQRDIYTIVSKSLETGAKLAAKGVTFLDVHFSCCREIALGLKELGLMKGNIEEAVAAGAHAMFFQCGTGHMMGLDVHDMEDLGEKYVGYTDELKKETSLFGLKSLRLGKQLEEGFVFTIEPGIYLIPDLIDLWKAEGKFKDFLNYDVIEKFRDFGGIRLENNYTINSFGTCEVIGTPPPITIEEIHDIRSLAF